VFLLPIPASRNSSSPRSAEFSPTTSDWGYALLSRISLIANIGSTLMMVGVIWFVQIVHYPLFALVGRDAFAKYETAHQTMTTWVVAPLMLIELASAFWLALNMISPVRPMEAWVGLALVALAWVSTFMLQVPLHDKLARSFDASSAERLVATNWVRTVAWTLRAALCLTWVGRLLR
jgi:hypothetical protein